MSLDNLILVCGILSVVLALYAGIPYLRSVLNGRTKPHQFSWLIFVIMNSIVTASQFLEGGRASVLISFTFTLYSIIIFGLSFRYGSRDTSKYDRWLLGLSLVTIAVWIITKSNAAAIWLTVLIDIFATTMMLLKIKADPHSEDPYPWAIGALAYVFSCITLLTVNPGALYVRPIYGLITDALLVGFIYYQIRLTKTLQKTGS